MIAFFLLSWEICTEAFPMNFMAILAGASAPSIVSALASASSTIVVNGPTASRVKALDPGQDSIQLSCLLVESIFHNLIQLRHSCFGALRVAVVPPPLLPSGVGDCLLEGVLKKLVRSF